MYKLKIKEIRKNRELTQTQLALIVGISQSFLSEIESGKYDISLSLLDRIGAALGIDPHSLVDFYLEENIFLPLK